MGNRINNKERLQENKLNQKVNLRSETKRTYQN